MFGLMVSALDVQSQSTVFDSWVSQAFFFDAVPFLEPFFFVVLDFFAASIFV